MMRKVWCQITGRCGSVLPDEEHWNPDEDKVVQQLRSHRAEAKRQTKLLRRELDIGDVLAETPPPPFVWWQEDGENGS